MCTSRSAIKKEIWCLDPTTCRSRERNVRSYLERKTPSQLRPASQVAGREGALLWSVAALVPPSAPSQVPPRPAAHAGDLPGRLLLEKREIQGCDGLQPPTPNSKTRPVQTGHRHLSPQPVAHLHQQHFFGLFQNLPGCEP